jgi:hypothetical protein
MNLYASLASSIGTPEASTLCNRLAAWHDAMVTHERRLRTMPQGEHCDEDCPHADAPTLWGEARSAFGARASRLSFLRLHGAKRAGVAQAANLAPHAAMEF